MAEAQQAERPSRGGVGFAVASALLFGLNKPCAKLLLGDTPPLLLSRRQQRHVERVGRGMPCSLPSRARSRRSSTGPEVR
jgi:hypothetical protein